MCSKSTNYGILFQGHVLTRVGHRTVIHKSQSGQDRSERSSYDDPKLVNQDSQDTREEEEFTGQASPTRS